MGASVRHSRGLGHPQGAPRVLLLFTVALLAAALSTMPVSRASIAPPAPATAPVFNACTFIPDPRSNTSYDCQDPFAPYAIANVSVSFEVNVTDPTNATSSNLSVTFYFDYWSAIAVVNPDSPAKRINVSSPGNSSVVVDTNWTYTAPNANFTGGQYFVNINVTNEANESSEVFFRVYVTYNSPPSISIPSVNPVSEPIRPVNPIVPLLYENVTVFDPDGDPVILTWDWGDGTRTVNTTGPLSAPLDLSVAHQYALSFFPLNETPRNVEVPVQVWIDDGLGHNETRTSNAEFYLDTDLRPTVRVDRPTVGSIWKVGEPVPMEGNASDPEGSPTTAYWDFDNRTDSTNTGDPTSNRDANGTAASHAYALPGTYNISFWATDGDKLLCFDSTCTNFTTHWTKAVVPIQVRNNEAPHLAVDPATGEIGTGTLLHAYVFDKDGDNMTVRWAFGDGAADATNVTETTPRDSGQGFDVYQMHNYTQAGNLTLTVYVSDGNSTVNLTASVFIQSFNLPPLVNGIEVSYANGTASGNNTFRVNDTVVVKVFVSDAENDTLDVSIDWADGGSNITTVDPTTSPDCSIDAQARKVCFVSFSHVYVDIGDTEYRNYNVQVRVTDNKVYLLQNATGGPPITLNHTRQQSVIIIVTDFHPEELGPWDWWDYSALAAVLGLPTVLIARFAWKVRRERQEA